MSNYVRFQFTVGDWVLLIIVAFLLVSSMYVAGFVVHMMLVGLRPSGDEVRTLLTFGGFMITTTGVTLKLAKSFDRRHRVHF